MSSEEINWTKLLRYVSGESDPEEQAEIEEWIASDTDHEAMVSFVEKIWSTPAENKEDWDVESAWLRYNIQHGKDFEETTKEEKIQGLDPIELQEKKYTRAARKSKDAFSWGLVVAAAATVLLVLLFTSQMEQEGAVSDFQPLKEIVSDYGQRTHFRLSDGTRVILNAGSKISTPKTFSDSVRSVQLEGQAFFDVATDSARPFLVNTNRSVTEVLGTKFDVRAYPGSEAVRVTVAEGKVALRSKQDTANLNGKTIAKDHMGYLSPEGTTTVTKAQNVAAHLGWTEGKLVFADDPLSRVKTTLERWYDIEIAIKGNKNGQLKSRRFTGSFTDAQSLEEVLEAIALSLNIKIEQESDGFYTVHE